MLAAIHRNVIFPLIEVARREPIRRCLSRLNRSQWYSRDQLKSLQWAKLTKLVHHCYNNIAYYRDTFRALGLLPQDIRSFDDFKRIALLTKESIRDFPDRLMEKSLRKPVEHCRSAGTLGKPVTIVRDSLSSAYVRASQLRGLSWYGVGVGDKQLRIWGLPLDNKLAIKKKREDRLLNRVRISAFDLVIERACAHFRSIRKFRPKYIYGYASSIYRICTLMSEKGLPGQDLKIRLVLTTSEPLYDPQRAFIEDYLGCRVVNEYGCSEVGPIAMECPEGRLHINMENVLVEFLSADNSEGRPPEIVVTNLNSYSMPLLRYRIGDTGWPLASECGCGRGLEIMGFDGGRIWGTLVSTSGHFISGAALFYIGFDIIQKYGGIVDFRVVQKNMKQLDITLSTNANFNDRILELFTDRIREVMGSNMQVRYIFRDEILPLPSGKRLYVCSELEKGSGIC